MANRILIYKKKNSFRQPLKILKISFFGNFEKNTKGPFTSTRKSPRKHKENQHNQPRNTQVTSFVKLTKPLLVLFYF
jgi:hypothetical protein